MKTPTISYLQHCNNRRANKLNILLTDPNPKSILKPQKLSEIQLEQEAKIHKSLSLANLLLVNNASGSRQSDPINSSEYDLLINLIKQNVGINTLNQRVANFIDDLIQNNRNLDTNTKEELQLKLIDHFDRQINLSILQNLNKDIEKFRQNEDYDQQSLEKKIDLSKQFFNYIGNKYKLEENATKILLGRLGFEYEEAYSHKLLLKTLENTAEKLELKSEIIDISKIIIEKFFNRSLMSYLHVNYPKVLVTDPENPNHPKFSTEKALSNNAVGDLAELLDTDYRREKDIFLATLKKKLDEKSLEPLYKGNSFGSNFEANKTVIDEGNEATMKLFDKVLDVFIPKSFSMISDSIAVSLNINPALALLNTISIASEIGFANKDLDAQANLRASQQEQNTQINIKLAEFKEAMQLLVSSPNINSPLEEIAQLYSDRSQTKKDIINFNTVQQTIRSLTPRASFYASLGFAGLLQDLGLVDGNGVLSYISTSMQAKNNTKTLLELINDTFPDCVRKIIKKDRLIDQLNSVRNSDTNQKRFSDLANINIEIQSLTDRKHRLNDVNLNIAQGEFLVIKGESGYGKTTLLEALYGLHELESGEIKIGGTDVNSIKLYGRDSLFENLITTNQFPKFISSKSLRENLEFGLYNKYSDTEIENILEKLGLENLNDRIDKPLGGLSGGQSIRLGIARLALRAIHKETGEKLVLMMDEPTASLDDDSNESKLSSAARVRNLISEIHNNDNEKEITIICVTHDKALRELSDREVDIKEINNLTT